MPLAGRWLIPRLLALLCVLGAGMILTQLVLDLHRVKTWKVDLAELRDVRHGLLDADQWVTRIAAAIETRIERFELTPENRPRIEQAVATFLEALIEQVEQSLRERNQRAGSGGLVQQLQGLLRQGVQDLLIDFDQLRARVPHTARELVTQLNTPASREQIKEQLVELVARGRDALAGEIDRTALEAVLQRHDCPEIAVCDQQLREWIAAAQPAIRWRLLAVLGLVAAVFVLTLAGRRGLPLERSQLALLTAATLVPLAGGLAAPMLAVEARITQLRLSLLGEPLIFQDQVLYFQSKSILEVMEILVATRAPDMLLVALLLTLFSLVFPTLKLLAGWIHCQGPRRLRETVLVRFFALRSGKWSMADVLVIAIFMAYLGFDGLIESQLAGLASLPTGVQVLTTNGTTLEPGFHLFLAFVIAGLALAEALERGCARK